MASEDFIISRSFSSRNNSSCFSSFLSSFWVVIVSFYCSKTQGVRGLNLARRYLILMVFTFMCARGLVVVLNCKARMSCPSKRPVLMRFFWTAEILPLICPEHHTAAQSSNPSNEHALLWRTILFLDSSAAFSFCSGPLGNLRDPRIELAVNFRTLKKIFLSCCDVTVMLDINGQNY